MFDIPRGNCIYAGMYPIRNGVVSVCPCDFNVCFFTYKCCGIKSTALPPLFVLQVLKCLLVINVL